MISILVDSFASAVVIDISSENSDNAPGDIRDNHSQVLRNMGVSDNLREAERHLEYYSANWKFNVRIFQFDARYGEEYWDLYLFIIDPSKVISQFTVIFIDETGEAAIFISNAQDHNAVLNDLKEQVCETGFGWSACNVEEVFSAEWAQRCLLNYDKKEQDISNLWELEWNKDYDENEFARLRCFIIQNKNTA